jgi:hypothetical protein
MGRTGRTVIEAGKSLSSNLDHVPEYAGLLYLADSLPTRAVPYRLHKLDRITGTTCSHGLHTGSATSRRWRSDAGRLNHTVMVGGNTCTTLFHKTLLHIITQRV